MPASTPNYALPYPTGSDAPCDFAEQWCDFTEAIQGVLDGFQDTLDRVYPVIPIAVLKVSEQIGLDGALFPRIPYDTVVIDTAGWTELDVSSALISPDVAGILTLQSSADFDARNGPGMNYLQPSDTLATLVPPNLSWATEMDTLVTSVGITVDQPVLRSAGLWRTGISGIGNLVQTSGPALNIGILRANFAMFWHADGGTF